MRHLYQFDLIEPRDTTLTLGEDATGTITMILMDEHRHCTQFILSNDEFNHLCDCVINWNLIPQSDSNIYAD
ncbi:hypothetical protein CXB77_04850 [Chromatium okenii]|uniref:Uncharacterized protein n=2 Tax=Chromatium okenii TaxID=61644 RepID=A0A2S7XU99_9GAMM|nr:hypothetical protein CXB77_04850 [Chromatium okenii]